MKKLFLLSLLAMFVFAGCTAKAGATFNIMDFGAKNDSTVLSTVAIQKAIDKATIKGGKVLVPAGNYQSGTIILKSNVEFHLEKGAQILGSLNLDDYSTETKGAIEAPALDRCLVYADGAENLKITGEGVINGRGWRKNFPIGDRKAYNQRPMLIRFIACENVELTDISFINSAAWTCHMIDCTNVVARRVKINSRVNRNNDGFDLDGCQKVLIEDCDVISGDDGICPKSTTTRLCEDIVVRNCRVSSHTSGFKCGTSSRGGFRNITVDSCYFYEVGMGAIKLQIVDGGIMDNIQITNVEMKDVEGPIFIRLGDRGRMYDKPTQQKQGIDLPNEGAPVGSMKNIVIKNIKATVTTEDQKRSGIMISGVPNASIENVTLENIDITFPGGVKKGEFKTEVKEDATRYPEQFFFGVLPSWGAYIRHANNVTFKNVTLKTVEPDVRKEVVLVNVKDFKRE